MDANEILAGFTIPAPCPMDWDRMPGDDRRRFCEACGKHVHDLTAMRPDERAALLATAALAGEEVCGRLHQPLERASVIPTACGAIPNQITGARQFTIRSIMAVIAAFATILGFMKVWLQSLEEPAPRPPMSRNSLIYMGKIAPRRNAPPTTVAPSCPNTASPGPGASG